MTLHMRDASNVLVEIGGYFMRDGSNALVEIGEEWVRDGGNVLQLVYSNASAPFTVDVTPDSYGARVSSNPGQVVTSEVIATPGGGLAPYTYLWERADANPEDWIIIAPTSPATTFRAAAVGPGDSFSAAFTCTVTDSRGDSVVSAEVSANATNYGTPP